MNTTIQETLLDLFHQVIEDPDRIPVVPNDGWLEDSEQRRLLTSLHDMLTLLQQSKQQAERQLREKEEQYRSLLALSRHFEKALAEMREREAQYRSIFEAVTDAILIIDLEDDRLVEVNPRAGELFGYTREEFLGRVMNLSDNTQEPPVFARDVVRAGGIFQ
jgi:PAS domain-containing protein